MTKYRIDIPSKIALMGIEVVEQYIKYTEKLNETRSRIREISNGLVDIDKAIVERIDTTRVANMTYEQLLTDKRLLKAVETNDLANMTYEQLLTDKRLLKAVETNDLANQKYELTMELLDLKELEVKLIHKLDKFSSWAK